eukprot:1077420-Amphidinium_carterae.3
MNGNLAIAASLLLSMWCKFAAGLVAVVSVHQARVAAEAASHLPHQYKNKLHDNKHCHDDF